MKMKKLLLILGMLLVGVCLLASCGSEEFDIDEEGIRYTEIKGGYSVSLEHCTAEEVKIPDEHNGKPVLVIDGMTKNANLVSVIIPDGVAAIGDRAFYYCTSLKRVEIPDSVTTIGAEAFYACTSLTEVELPDGLAELGIRSFAACASLKTITIPDNIATIANETFRACTSLTDVTIGKNVRGIGAYAFEGCASLEKIDIPDTVKTLNMGVFKNCVSLKGGNHLAYAEGLAGVLVLGKGLENIYAEAFMNCGKLKQVIVPETIKKIGDGVFKDCDNMKAVLYEGTELTWLKAKAERPLDDEFLNNSFYYYSETEPTVQGKFWCWSLIDGSVIPTIWPAK